MKTNFRLILFCKFILLLIISSCVKDEYYLQNMKTPEWDPNFAAPLINSNLSIWDIVNDYDSSDVIIDDATHFVYLVYTGRVFSQTAEELIQLGDHSMNTGHTFNINGPVAVGDSFVTTFSYNYAFNFPNNKIIDSLFLKNGNLNVSINSNFNMPAKIEIQLPGTKNGLPFKEKIIMSGPNTSQNINLSNTKFLFTQVGAPNQMQMNFRVVLYGNNGQNLSPYNISIYNTFSALEFKAIFGYLGQINFWLSDDTVSVKLYNNNIEGVINWQDPKFYLTVTNYIGMPVKIDINEIKAKRTKEPAASMVITGAGIPNPWFILYPTFAQIGQGVLSTMELNKTNSNVDAAFNISPQKIYALLDATGNPTGFQKNFAFDTSRFIVDAKVELPMHGTANGFVIEDTLDINFGEDFADVEHIEWVRFKIYCKNDFPVDALIQLYFIDEYNAIVDSLLSPLQQFVYAATPGPAPDYYVINSTEKMITTVVPKERIQHYNRVKKAVVRAKMDSYNNGNQIVKLYSFYRMHVMLGAQVQLKF